MNNDKDGRDMADLAFGGSSAVSGDAWNQTEIELARLDGEMSGINLTKSKDQTDEQKARLAVLRKRCGEVGQTRYALASQASLPKRGTEPSVIEAAETLKKQLHANHPREDLDLALVWKLIIAALAESEPSKRGTEPSLLARINEAASLHASRTEFGEVIFPADRWDAFVLALAESAPSEAEPVLIASQDDLREARDHCLYASDMDLRHQGKALRDWAIPALEYALASHAETVPHVPAGQDQEAMKDEYRKGFIDGQIDMRASMQAEAPQAGWKLVPVEPTLEMCLAEWNVSMSDAHSETGTSEAAWRAMLNAAPEAPQATKDAEDDLRFVERWAVHHASKPHMTAEEALSVIANYPPIRAITKGYEDAARKSQGEAP